MSKRMPILHSGVRSRTFLVKGGSICTDQNWQARLAAVGVEGNRNVKCEGTGLSFSRIWPQ